MKKIFQTTFFDSDKGTRGDCLRACLSSITEFPIELFPLSTWIGDYYDLFLPLGLDYEFVSNVSLIGDHPGIDGMYIAYGETERTGRLHAVVINATGELVHDPYPSGNGLTKIIGVHLISKL
jgi:hypothetical protein